MRTGWQRAAQQRLRERIEEFGAPEITEVDCCQTSTCGLLSPLRVRTSLHVSRPKRRKRPGWTASSEQ